MDTLEPGVEHWLQVIAKALATIALRDKSGAQRLEQAAFLESLGLTRPEAAEILGISAATLRSLASQQRASGRGKKK